MGSSSIVQSVGLHLSRREYWDRPKSRVSRASKTPPRCCCTNPARIEALFCCQFLALLISALIALSQILRGRGP